MSDSRYKAFVTAVECGSITKAAEILGYTQSGVSHLIDALEGELGFRLLVRSRGGCGLTAEGMEMLPHVRAMLAAGESVTAVASGIKGLKSGSLRVGTFSSVALQWLPELLNAFLTRYPGIDVEILNGTYSTIENAIFQRSVDCGFVTSPVGSGTERFAADIAVMPIAEDHLIAVLPAGHRFEGRTGIDPAELQDEGFIIPAEGSGYDVSTVFSLMEKTPVIRFDMSDDFAAIGMVRAGLGVTVLPQLLLKDYPMDGLCAVPISGITRHIGLAYHREYVSPAVKAFIDTIKERELGMHSSGDQQKSKF